ncbi:hypothetical protein [Streptomyces galilaeus]|uniref:hypothetical protein n=1 Tax=Streptomyces galilaeus TaxID=33899 RepID=UPI00123DDCF7|nr:hypothetical protein [Streptomyces galilaeus]GGW45070.1 hypothetical protein GCM10010350_31220 [Streptomyces galilaeus]
MKHRKRSRTFARASGTWYRLFGTIEVCLGVVLPLLFIYPQTVSKVWLLATVSVAISVSAALKAFWGWQEQWAIFQAQSITLAQVISEWEISMLNLALDSPATKKQEALSITGHAANKLFGILNQEHETRFHQVQPPEMVIAAINKQGRYAGVDQAVQQQQQPPQQSPQQQQPAAPGVAP